MNKALAATIGAAAILTGAAIIGLGEKKHEIPKEAIQEHQVVPRAVISPGGRPIRVVGVHKVSTDVRETALGRVVVGELIRRSLCLVVFEAEEIDGKPDLGDDLWTKKGMEPIKIVGSLSDGKYVWFSLFKNNGCNLIADHPGYFGSTLKEFLALPLDTQVRFLKEEDGVMFFPNSLMGRKDLNFVEEIGGILQDRVVMPVETL